MAKQKSAACSTCRRPTKRDIGVRRAAAATTTASSNSIIERAQNPRSTTLIPTPKGTAEQRTTGNIGGRATIPTT